MEACDSHVYFTRAILDCRQPGSLSLSCAITQIAGFTAWSSSREPEQVFILLETLYRAFDK